MCQFFASFFWVGRGLVKGRGGGGRGDVQLTLSAYPLNVVTPFPLNPRLLNPLSGSPFGLLTNPSKLLHWSSLQDPSSTTSSPSPLRREEAADVLCGRLCLSDVAGSGPVPQAWKCGGREERCGLCERERTRRYGSEDRSGKDEAVSAQLEAESLAREGSSEREDGREVSRGLCERMRELRCCIEERSWGGMEVRELCVATKALREVREASSEGSSVRPQLERLRTSATSCQPH